MKKNFSKNQNEGMMKAKQAVSKGVFIPDTSVIIEGLVSRKIIAGELKPSTIILHEASLSELEHQANQGRQTGYLGLDEIKKIRELSKKYNFKIDYIGEKPVEFDIKSARSGGIDSIIRNSAYENNATLITADKVQALVAEAKGVDVILFKFDVKPRKLRLEQFFDQTTMSVHIRENLPIKGKKGLPGKWTFQTIRKELVGHDEIKEMAKEIVEEAGFRRDSFIEIERKGSTIIQLGNYRIVITRPSFSDAWEITAVRPIKKMTFEEYKLSEKLRQRISEQAEGILISGAPGMGKSTFAQGLAEFFASKNKIVKTVEAPRDLDLSENITQYSMSLSSAEEIHDILLLSRPDYTIFDEMRNTDDFKLFGDLRLSGVGMMGVVHATNPIDAIQRFIGRIELGVIPHVIDTVVFIKDGQVAKTFSVQMEIKVPSGMVEADLARPVVTVRDFETQKLEFELYSYGEETVVIPIEDNAETGKESGANKLAAKAIEKTLRRFSDEIVVDIISNNKCNVYVPKKDIAAIIGREGKNISELEQELGIGINVEELEGEPKSEGKPVNFRLELTGKYIVLYVDQKLVDKDVNIYVDGEYLFTAHVGRKADISIKKKNNIGEILYDAYSSKRRIELRSL